MTTELLLPPGIVLPSRLKKVPIAAAAEATNEEKAAAMPRPSGYKLLCICPDVAETFEDTSIVMAESTRRGEEHGTVLMFVLETGPDAYSDRVKFPTGPWCKKGDFIVVRTYTGTRFKIFGKEFRILNDDQVEAVVEDPRGFGRA